MAKKEQAAKPQAEVKERLTATEDEVAAAIAGVLKPRKVHGDAKQANMKSLGENGRPSGRPIGITAGLPILLSWCYIFQKNERAPKSQKLTDEQISAWMYDEFKGRPTAAFKNVNGCRTLYNAGRFTRNAIPKVQSSRYDESGNAISGRPARAAGPVSKKANEGMPPARPGHVPTRDAVLRGIKKAEEKGKAIARSMNLDKPVRGSKGAPAPAAKVGKKAKRDEEEVIAA